MQLAEQISIYTQEHWKQVGFKNQNTSKVKPGKQSLLLYHNIRIFFCFILINLQLNATEYTLSKKNPHLSIALAIPVIDNNYSYYSYVVNN